jgi:general secretion pathway protein D
MRKATGPRLGVLILGLAIWAAPARAQGDDDLTEIKLGKDTQISDFLDAISRNTGKPILYDPTSTKIGKNTLGSSLSHKVPKARAFDTFRAILAFYELTLIPIGPKGYEIYLCIDSRSTNNLIKNKAVYIDYRELEQYEDNDGLFISCAIPIKNIENLTMLRTALSTMITPAGIGKVHEVPGSQSIIVMDYAPTVSAMAKLIMQMDVRPPGKQLVLKFIELNYAYADDVADIITQLVEAQREAAAPIQRGQAASGVPTSPEPRIIAYEPRNALVIAATEDDFNLISELIERFDQETPPVSMVEVVRLSHVEAEDVADTLTQVLEGLGTALAAPGPGGTPAQQPGRPQQQGIRRTGGRTEDYEPQVVPDPVTNALILAANQRTIRALRDIIQQLDIPKDQVLLEATLISLTRTDDFQLGVELTGIDTGGLTSDSPSGFGVTNWGLSTFQDTDNDGIPDINVPTSLTEEGGGLVAGIFRSGGIPVLLQAVQRLNNATIVAMPSVVTYENKAATIKSLQEQPVGEQTEFSSGSVGQGFDEFVSAGVTLTVSPHISADNYLRLEIELEVSSFTGTAGAVGLPPPRITNNLVSTVALPNGYTVVMGGLIGDEETVSEDKIPLLGDIPAIGYLFKSKTRRKIKRNLFIFVTPHILRQQGVTFDELHRQSWIAKMKADELIKAIDIHNSNFRDDPRFKTPDEAGFAALDVSSFVDAGRFQEVPPDVALAEIQRLRNRTAKGSGK